MLEGGGHRLELPYIRLDGKSRCKALRRTGVQEEYVAGLVAEQYITHEFPEAAGRTVDYRVELIYEDWMEQASLVVHEEIYGCAGKRQGLLHTLYRPQEVATETTRRKNNGCLSSRLLYSSPGRRKTPFRIGKCLSGFPAGTKYDPGQFS